MLGLRSTHRPNKRHLLSKPEVSVFCRRLEPQINQQFVAPFGHTTVVDELGGVTTVVRGGGELRSTLTHAASPRARPTINVIIRIISSCNVLDACQRSERSRVPLPRRIDRLSKEKPALCSAGSVEGRNVMARGEKAPRTFVPNQRRLRGTVPFQPSAIVLLEPGRSCGVSCSGQVSKRDGGEAENGRFSGTVVAMRHIP